MCTETVSMCTDNVQLKGHLIVYCVKRGHSVVAKNALTD